MATLTSKMATPSTKMLRRLAASAPRARLSTASAAAGDAPEAADSAVARSYRDVARAGPRVRELLLPRSPDLTCKNLMCEHVGDACACRLALVLERAPALERLDLSRNDLRALPDAAFALARLRELDASHNRLAALPELVAQLQALEVLDLRGNQLERLPERALEALPRLREVRVGQNPRLDAAAIASPALRGKLVQ